MYLLDTVVLSEMRKKNRDPHVVAWLTSVRPEEMFASTVTIFEVEMGVVREQRRDAAFAARLKDWLDDVIISFGDRVLPLTTSIARHWGQLAGKIGHQELDLAIAATALEHGLTVVTRNVSDFGPTGVATLDPFRPKRRAPT